MNLKKTISHVYYPFIQMTS